MLSPHTGKHIRTLQTELPAIKTLRFKPNDKSTYGSLCAIGCNGVVQQWDMKKQKVQFESAETLDSLYCADYTNTGDHLLTAGESKDVYMYDTTTFQQVNNFASKNMKVWNVVGICSLKSHPTDPNLFVTGGRDKSIKLYDVRMEGAYKSISGPFVLEDNSIDIFGDMVLTGSNENTEEMKVVSLSQQILTNTFNFDINNSQFTGFVQTSGFLDNGSLVYAGGAGRNEFKVFSNDSDKPESFFDCQYSVSGFKAPVTHVVKQEDENLMFIGLRNGDVFNMKYNVKNTSDVDMD